jgi:lipoyl(octanoyl) transferase
MPTPTTRPNPPRRGAPQRPLRVTHHGLLAYQDALGMQHRHAEHLQRGVGEDLLMLLEHQSVYTAGRRTLPEHMPTDGTPVIPVDRGGLVTWHGPGQLVGYPVVRLRDSKGVALYVDALEEALIRVCRAAGVDCVGGPAGRSGVWVAGSCDLPRKIAAIGIRVHEGVTTHGFALNCDPDLSAYDNIVPCGIRDAVVTSLSAELGRRCTVAEIRNLVAREVQSAIEPLLAVC